MGAVRAHLIRRGSGVILLLSPPFDHTALDPGYIKGYIPGIRENGGQYTHAAAWVVLALARLGSGDEAMELFHMLNPINHSRTARQVEQYMTEPYSVAGDVSRPPGSPGPRRLDLVHRVGRLDVPGWIGRNPRAAALRCVPPLNPCIPSSWPTYSIEWRFGRAHYTIVVENPERRCGGVASVELDGSPADPAAIPLQDDGRVHRVRVVLGPGRDTPAGFAPPPATQASGKDP